MILPKEIAGKNRIRDFQICGDYIDGLSTLKLADIYGLTRQRISTIIKNNTQFVLNNGTWSKAKRIIMLQRLHKKTGLHLASTKDSINILEQIRKEVEGDKPLIKQESHYHFTTVVEELHATAKGKNDTAGKSTRDISSLES